MSTIGSASHMEKLDEINRLRALNAELARALEITRMQIATHMAGKNALSNEKHLSIVEAALSKHPPAHRSGE